ncbi:MAG: hypothetical protein O7G84_01275 [Gammaproteobacteria bacterium]|nr:hypothetical protein [Gammaproteobacteria bacterium]
MDSSPGSAEDQPFRIIGLSTNKIFGQAATWTLTVKGRGKEQGPLSSRDVMDLWEDPEDVWVRIVVVKDGVPTEVLFGLMNTVTESMTRDGAGARNETYTLTGQDFHKVFDRTQLYINIHENAGQLPIIPLYDAVSENLIGTPDEVMSVLLRAWLGNNGVADKQWALPQSLGGKFFFDLLGLDFGDLRGNIFDPSLYSPDQMMGRSLWQTMTEYSNGMLNEMYTETFEDVPFDRNRPPRPRLTLRERPFPTRDKNNRSWEDLLTHDLGLGDIKARNMSKGAPESRFNYWLLDSKGLVGDGLGTLMQIQQASNRELGVPGSAPIYNIEDIRRHGFRKFTQSTRYFPFREDPKWLTHSARWLQMLHDWYAVAPFELSGTLTTTSIFPGIRIGHRVREARRGGSSIVYYVEGVTQNWQFPAAGSTTLNLTRGEAEGKHLLDMVYDKITGSGTGALDSMLEAATGLVVGTPLGDAVPHGSGPRLDKAVGQVKTAERIYLDTQGVTVDDQQHIARGELTGKHEEDIPDLRPADLPDQQTTLEQEILVGRAEPRERTQGGNLTQRELESGRRLPALEPTDNETENADLTRDQQDLKWRRRRQR